MAAAEADDGQQSAPTVILQPGAHYLYLGLASDTFAQQIPHVYAERCSPGTDVPATAAAEPLPASPARLAALRQLQQEVMIPRDPRGQPLETRRVGPHDLTQHNQLVKPQRVAPHNDPDAIDARPMAAEPLQDPAVLYGEEALQLPPSATHYRLCWPWRAGKVVPQTGRSQHQVLDQLGGLWHWAITTKLRIPMNSRRSARVVLILADTCRRRPMKELMQLLLVDLGFGSALICHESLCVSFAAGLSQACVVSMGHSCTSVACVSEGLVVTETRIMLPSGFEHVASTLHWLMRRAGCFENMPPMTQLPAEDSMLRRTNLDVLAANVARLDYDTLRSKEIVTDIRLPGEPTLRAAYTLNKEPAIAAMGYFYPDIFGLDENKALAVQQHLRDKRVESDDYVVVDNRSGEPPVVTPSKLRMGQQHTTSTITTGIEAEAEGGLQPSGAGGTHSTASNFGGQDESMLAVDTSLEAETPAKRSASSDRAPKSPTPREDQGATETKADKDGDVPMPDKAAAAGTAGDRSGPSSPQHPTKSAGGARPHGVPVFSSKRIMSLDAAITAAICKMPSSERLQFYTSIIIAGGGAALRNLPDVLQQRLWMALPDTLQSTISDIKVISRPRDLDPTQLAWKGGAIVASLPSTNEYFVSTKDWDLHGVNAMREKFPFTW